MVFDGVPFVVLVVLAIGGQHALIVYDGSPRPSILQQLHSRYWHTADPVQDVETEQEIEVPVTFDELLSSVDNSAPGGQVPVNFDDSVETPTPTPLPPPPPPPPVGPKEMELPVFMMPPGAVVDEPVALYLFEPRYADEEEWREREGERVGERRRRERRDGRERKRCSVADRRADTLPVPPGTKPSRAS